MAAKPPADDGALDWKRFVGILSHVAIDDGPSPPGLVRRPTFGVSSYICDCCGRKHIALACISDEGVEVNVTVPPGVGLQIAAEIYGAVQKVEPRRPS